jgi:Domain of unknown function (DUF4160)
MPEVSRFYGIIIYMYLQDHNPPHFHAKYNDFQIVISIENFAVLNGKLPSKALALVIEWASIHQEELLQNWNNLSNADNGTFNKIEPLN